MESWIYFVFISQGIWAFCTIIDKFVISKGYIKSSRVFIVLNGAMNIFIIFLLPFVDFYLLKFTDMLVALLSGVMLAAAVTLYYKAVQYDEISRVTMLNQITPAFVLILSFLFLSDVLTKNHLIGFLFLLGSGLLVSYRASEKKFKWSKAFYYMLASAFLSAISVVSAKYIFSVTDFWNAVLWLRIASFSALGALFIPSVRKQFVETFKGMANKIKGLLGFKMIIDFSAMIISGFAVLMGPIYLVSALASSVLPLFVFILASITSVYIPKIVKEDIDKKTILTKTLSIVMIIIGVVFINLS